MKAAIAAALAASAPLGAAVPSNGLAKLPPMGWMSWQYFRCEVDCNAHPTACINEDLYTSVTDALVQEGFAKAGYNSIHMDDCWPSWNRDPSSKKLVPNATRFPHGMGWLADYAHAQSVEFAIYTAESAETCAGYPASLGYEQLDADTFAEWNVDYLKVDGCGDDSAYPGGYKAMGQALYNSGRPIVYSCSWPAYLPSDQANYTQYILDGCNLWRNWDDIQCSWSSLASIIDHWGTWGKNLSAYAGIHNGTGAWHDADMLIVGAGCLTAQEERTQMAIWPIIASPLIMGNDPRNVSADSKALLTNPEAIAVSQDPAGMMGYRISPSGPTEVWARNLSDGSVAVALFNKLGNAAPPATCNSWNKTTGGYLEACGGGSGDISCFSSVSLDAALSACCGNPACAGFSYDASGQSGCYKTNTQCGLVTDPSYDGYYKPSFAPPVCGPVDIELDFAAVGLSSSASVRVRDIFARADVGTFNGGYTAKQVGCHDSAFLRLYPQ